MTKIQCERCREIVPLAFSPGVGGIEVTCPACSASYFLAATCKPAPPPPAVGAVACPKCGHAQPPADACRRCGLVFARWQGTSAPHAGFDEQAAALWAAVEEHWDDPAAHTAFLAHCRKAEILAFAAARYRSAQARRGPDDPVAAERLQELRRLAEFALTREVRAGAVSRRPYRAALVVLIALLVLLAAGAAYLGFLSMVR